MNLNLTSSMSKENKKVFNALGRKTYVVSISIVKSYLKKRDVNYNVENEH